MTRFPEWERLRYSIPLFKMGLPRLSKQTSSKIPSLCSAVFKRSPAKRLKVRSSGLFFMSTFFCRSLSAAAKAFSNSSPVSVLVFAKKTFVMSVPPRIFYNILPCVSTKNPAIRRAFKEGYRIFAKIFIFCKTAARLKTIYPK